MKRSRKRRRNWFMPRNMHIRFKHTFSQAWHLALRCSYICMFRCFGMFFYGIHAQPRHSPHLKQYNWHKALLMIYSCTCLCTHVYPPTDPIEEMLNKFSVEMSMESRCDVNKHTCYTHFSCGYAQGHRWDIQYNKSHYHIYPKKEEINIDP